MREEQNLSWRLLKLSEHVRDGWCHHRDIRYSLKAVCGIERLEVGNRFQCRLQSRGLLVVPLRHKVEEANLSPLVCAMMETNTSL